MVRDVLTLLVLSGCAAELPACPTTSPNDVYLISHGWHTDLALSPDGPLTPFRAIFPGVRYLVVGFGRRTFLAAPVHDAADLLIGPFPGNGALEVLGLNAPPTIAYLSGTVAELPLTPPERAKLNDAIWSSLEKTPAGAPRAIAGGSVSGSLLYAATLGYSGFYTCNTWTADMLRRAGLPVSPTLDVFAAQTMARAAPLTPRGLCRISPASAPEPPVHSAG